MQTDNVVPASTGVSITSSAVVATGNLEAINHYAPLIGICLSVVSIMLGLTFFIVNHKREVRKTKAYVEELKKEIIKEMMDENVN